MVDINNSCNAVATEAEGPSAIALPPNVAAALTYLLGWVTGILFLIFERDNEFVRFHAMQSILVFGPISIAMFAIGLVPVAGWIINLVIGFAAFAAWITLMLRAYSGKACTFPFGISIAEQQLKSRS